MPLPELIEIVPLRAPLAASITVPGSKSLTNRALVLAAWAEGETILRGALWSDDTQVMVECLQELGFLVTVQPDPAEASNRTITVYGQGGRVPRGGTRESPLELFVGNAGTAARFLAAMVCVGEGAYRLHGTTRMHERPQAALLRALRELGYRVESINDRLPAVFHGVGRRPGRCRVSIAESSQFASALLLSAKAGDWEIEVAGENAEESPYVAMTLEMGKTFPRRGGVFQVEPDASSGSYFWAASWLVASLSGAGAWATPSALPVQVAQWPTSGWQIDADFPKYLPLPARLSRQVHLGDSIMTAIALAALAAMRRAESAPDAAVCFTDLGRLRAQECERVVALRTELSRCGARVVERGDTLEVFPSVMHGAEIETYDDHRMAMCFAILGLKVPGIKIKNPACVKKTFPDFFQKLAAPPPAGLGVSVLHGRSGERLKPADLGAE